MSDLYLYTLAARSYDTPPNRLAEIARETKAPEVLSLLAQNPNTPSHVLVRLIEDHPREVANNAAFSLALLEQPDLISSLSETSQHKLASHPETPDAILGMLLAHGKHPAHFIISQREMLSERLLEEMVLRSSYPTEALAHANATEQTWLSATEKKELHRWLAQSPRLPEIARRALEASDDAQTRQALDWRGEPASMGKRLSLRFAGKTDPGMVREHNEDDLMMSQGESLALFAVFDGMGGQSSGRIASEAAAKRFSQELSRADRSPCQPQSFLHQLFIDAHDEIVQAGYSHADVTRYTKGKKLPNSNQATTAATLLLQNNTAYTANIGDSRVYLYRGGELSQLTQDHTLINDAAMLGYEFTEEQKKQYKNIITRCLGMERRSAAPDLTRLSTLPGDLFVLCTDGVHGMISDAQLSALLAEGSIEEKVARIMKASLEAGGQDNLTVVIVEVL